MAVRPRTWGIIASACLYMTLALLTLNLAVQQGLILDAGKAVSFGSARPGPARDGTVPLPALGNKLMGEMSRAVEKLSPAQRERALVENLPDLNKISPTSVEQAAGVVEFLTGVDTGRQYAPKTGVGGRFDADSAVLHDIVKISRGAKTVYQFTMVDRDGRTMPVDMDQSAMTDDDMAAFRVYEMARHNPGLRRLVDAAVKIGTQSQPGQGGK